MRLVDLFEEQKPGKIAWVPPYPRLIADGSDAIVWIDITKLDRSFQQDTGFYVGPGGEGGIDDRYDRFGEWLAQGIPVKMPEVGLNWRGEIGFGNGRHRYAWMRDHGAKALPVTVPAEEADDIRRRFGTRLRATVLRAPV